MKVSILAVVPFAMCLVGCASNSQGLSGDNPHQGKPFFGYELGQTMNKREMQNISLGVNENLSFVMDSSNRIEAINKTVTRLPDEPTCNMYYNRDRDKISESENLYNSYYSRNSQESSGTIHSNEFYKLSEVNCFQGRGGYSYSFIITDNSKGSLQASKGYVVRHQANETEESHSFTQPIRNLGSSVGRVVILGLKLPIMIINNPGGFSDAMENGTGLDL